MSIQSSMQSPTALCLARLCFPFFLQRLAAAHRHVTNTSDLENTEDQAPKATSCSKNVRFSIRENSHLAPGGKKCRCKNDEPPICAGGQSLPYHWYPSESLDKYCECIEPSRTQTWYQETQQRPDERGCIDAVYDDLLLRNWGTAGTADVAYPKALTHQAHIECLLDEAEKFMGVDEPMAGVHENFVWMLSRSERYTPILKNVVLDKPTQVIAIGDVHGRLGSLWQIHQLWLQLGMEPYVVFLGDAVDRGLRQLEVAAALIAWRAKFPHKVSILRGNHESSEINDKYGFHCVSGHRANFFNRCPYPLGGFFARFNRFFTLIPRALRIAQPDPSRNAAFMHGGFGPEVNAALSRGEPSPKDEPRKRVVTLEKKVERELIWSEGYCSVEEGDDCGELNKTGFVFNAKRQAGYIHSQAATESFLDMMGACVLVTGHSHVSEILWQKHGAGSGECTSMAHAVTLSAHNFFGDGEPGFVSLVNVEGEPLVSQQAVFPDAVPESLAVLDAGKGEGAYPKWPTCAFE